MRPVNGMTTWVMHDKSHHMSHSWQVPPHESCMTSPGKWYDYLMLRAYSCVAWQEADVMVHMSVVVACFNCLVFPIHEWISGGTCHEWIMWWDLWCMTHVVGLPVMNDSCHISRVATHEPVMSSSDSWTSHTTHVKSHHTCRVTPHMLGCYSWISHVVLLLINESCHT